MSCALPLQYVVSHVRRTMWENTMAGHAWPWYFPSDGGGTWHQGFDDLLEELH